MSILNESNKQEEQGSYKQSKSAGWIEFLYYLGYNLNNKDDTERLYKNFIWLDKQRARAEKLAAMRLSIFITVLTALGTGIITVLGSWILKTFKP